MPLDVILISVHIKSIWINNQEIKAQLVLFLTYHDKKCSQLSCYSEESVQWIVEL